MGELTCSVMTVLPSLQSELAQSVVQTLLESGVESCADLHYVEEQDLNMLKPIQRRKLLSAWKPKGKLYFLPFISIKNLFVAPLPLFNNIHSKIMWWPTSHISNMRTEKVIQGTYH